MGKFAKDRRDIFYRKAKQEGFRARSAFKLLQLDDEFDLLNDDLRRVVDLCSAPGSWSQVLSSRLVDKEGGGDDATIVAVDIQEMSPIPGVKFVRGDITTRETAEAILECFEGKRAQLVISDGAPDVTGLHDMDEFVQAQLLVSALNIATLILQEGGTFVAKIFRGKDVGLLYKQFQIFFADVQVAKPMSSRNSSAEAFIVCHAFRVPEGFTPSMDKGIQALIYSDQEEKLTGHDRTIARFVACGDVDGMDPNRSYQIEEQETYQPPVHPPIKPSYEKAVERAKRPFPQSTEE